MPIGLIIAVIIAAGAGVSFTAGTAVPGDALYGVKVNVNETLEDAVALSARTQAQADASIALERVEEAEELAAAGELNADVAAQLEERFLSRANAFERNIERLRARGNIEAAAEVASNFEAGLETHERVLTQLEERGEHVAGILERVRARINHVANVRADAEARITSQLGANVEAASRGRLRATENKITEVERYIDRMEERLDAGVAADARAQLSEARSLTAEGETELSTGSFGEAFVLFQQAHRLAQQAKLTAQTQTKLNIQVTVGEGADREEDEDEADNGDGDENENTNGGVEAEGEVRVDLGL